MALKSLPFLFSIVCLSASAQTTSSKQWEKEFKKFDGNESGWLSGLELDACGCRSFDKDGDNEVTPAEYQAGKAAKSGTLAGSAPPPKKPQPPAPVNTSTPGANAGSSDIRGTWWYTTMMYANGTVYVLGSRQSNLELKGDSRYTLNTWLGGANNMRTEGKYSATRDKLVLVQDNGDKKTYNLSFSGDGAIMTIVAPDGSGYKAERLRK